MLLILFKIDKIYPFLFVGEACLKYAYLKFGTLNRKYQYLMQIIFVTTPSFLDLKNMEKLSCIVVSVLRIVNKDAYLNNLNYYKIHHYEFYKKARNEVEEFFETVFIKLETNRRNSLEELLKVPLPEDWLQCRYRTVNVEQVFCMDTTERGKCAYVTFLMDLSSRYIVHYLFTVEIPKAEDLVGWLNEYFFNKDKDHIVIIHCDESGANVSDVFLNYCKKNNIVISYGDKQFGNFNNQVMERYNKTFWDLVAAFTFEGAEDCSFFDLNEMEKKELVKCCIQMYNERKSAANGYNRKYSPMEMFYALKTTKVSELVFASSKNVYWSTIIEMFDIFAISRMELIKKQNMLQKDLGIEVNLEGGLSEIVIKKQLDAKDIKERHKIVINSIEFIDLLNKMQTPAEKRKLLIEYFKGINLDNIETEEKNNIQITLAALNLEETFKTQEFDRLSYQETQAKLDELLKEQLKWKEEKRRKLKKRKEKEKLKFKKKMKSKQKTKVKYIITTDDKRIILAHVKDYTKRESNFTVARDRIAHCFLGTYGVRVGNLIYLNLSQLDNYYKRRTVYLNLIKKKFTNKIQLPYVKSALEFIQETSKDFEIVKKLYQDNKKEIDDRLAKKYGENWKAQGISEIWGYLERTYISARMNGQLRRIGRENIVPSKDITTHSYRRGIAITIVREKGIWAAQKALFHEHISTTEAYLPKLEDVKLLEEYFNLGIIKNTTESEKKINYDLKNSRSFKKSFNYVEKMLDKEKLQDQYPYLNEDDFKML